jgi:hypothetical protein
MNATSAVKRLKMRVINLLRPKKVVHAYGTRNLGQQTLTVNGVTVMQHPFTFFVAGCTQSGKTVWVKSLLENAQTTISPAPQRRAVASIYSWGGGGV